MSSSASRTTRCCSLRTILLVLASVCVLAIVTGLLAIAVQKVRFASYRSQSTGRLKQMGLAMHGIAGRKNGLLPPSVGKFPEEKGPNTTLFFHMLPDIEQDRIYTTYLSNPDEVSPDDGTGQDLLHTDGSH